MSQSGYRTAPIASPDMPAGIPYIVGNEAAERFSYYGMRSILVVFMTKYMVDSAGMPDHMTEEQAKATFHGFMFLSYFFPMLGALLADAVWGKYRTILWLSMGYCLGHLALAIDDTRAGLYAGLLMVAIGAGGVKPCVTAHVGDQFGASNQHLMTRAFQWFYFSINFGAVFSQVLMPRLLEHYGPAPAFAVPGILMLLATIVFWLGRWQFVHVPPGGRRFLRDTFSREGATVAGRLGVLYLFVAMFWSLFDQTGSEWVLQANQMDRFIDFSWMEDWIPAWIPTQFELLPAEIQAANPLLVLLLIPTFSFVVYPVINVVFPLTPLRKIGIGFFLTALSFAVLGWAQERIDAGQSPHIGWQVVAYVILTAGEVMVSITGLEFSYTQAPNTMKSLVMALWFLSVSLGNAFTSVVNILIQNPDGSSKLSGASYFWFFTAMMLGTTAAFLVFALRYRGKTYIQQESPSATA